MIAFAYHLNFEWEPIQAPVETARFPLWPPDWMLAMFYGNQKTPWYTDLN